MVVQHHLVRTMVVDVVAMAADVEEVVVADGTTVIALGHRDVVLAVLDVDLTLDHVLLTVAHQRVVPSSHVPTAQWPENPTAVATAETGSPLQVPRDQHALPHAVAAGRKCIC